MVFGGFWSNPANQDGCHSEMNTSCDAIIGSCDAIPHDVDVKGDISQHTVW